jgi:hypothetical protein
MSSQEWLCDGLDVKEGPPFAVLFLTVPTVAQEMSPPV